MPSRTITITAYRRPDCFRQLLLSLRANDLAGWRIVVAIEPTELASQHLDIAREILSPADYEATINPRQLGVRENPYHLLNRVFASGADICLYLEEDLRLSPDVTRLAAWFAETRRPEWFCLSLLSGGCGSAGLLSDPSYPELLFPAKTFNSLGFAVTRDQWYARMQPAWMTDQPICDLAGDPKVGWDWSLYRVLLDTRDLFSLSPVAARSTHTGRLGGVHCTPAFHDLAFKDLPIFEGAPGLLDYRAIDIAMLPPPVARHVRLWAEMTRALTTITRMQRPPASNQPDFALHAGSAAAQPEADSDRKSIGRIGVVRTGWRLAQSFFRTAIASCRPGKARS